MAISQNFLTGRMKKSAGGTRFSTWRGLNVVASKPIQVKQNVTPAVKLNRSKMSIIGKGVSKLNLYVNLFYSLGIAKTTPFADTVRVFRNAMSDSLKLDATKLSKTSFGTGNIAEVSFHVETSNVSTFSVAANETVTMFENDDVITTLVVFNENFTKINVSQVNDDQLQPVVADLTTSGFTVGEKVGYAVKRVQYKPGADLSGKVKFFSEANFITLT